MAIYFQNDKILEPKQDGTSLQRRYFKEREELKTLFNKFRKNGDSRAVIILKRDWKKHWNTKGTSYKPAPPRAFPLKATIEDTELGSVTVRYSKQPPEKTDTGRLIWPLDRNSMMEEMKSISEDQLDLAWFLLRASKYVEKGIFKVHDEQVEFEGEFKNILKQADASKILFSNDVTREDVLTLAEMILPPEMQIEGDTKEIVSVRLWDIVSKGDKAKKEYNYDALIRANEKMKKAEADSVIKEVGKPLISVDFEDGRTMNVPSLKCPAAKKDEKMKQEAEVFDIPVKGLSRDELYSVIKFKQALDD